jgi:hypothetical protein
MNIQPNGDILIKKLPLVLLLVLYGCETWSLALREESRLRVSDNRVLRRMFGSEREVTAGWRKFHNEELHNLCPLPNIITYLLTSPLRSHWNIGP